MMLDPPLKRTFEAGLISPVSQAPPQLPTGLGGGLTLQPAREASIQLSNIKARINERTNTTEHLCVLMWLH
jgi:hypothetical protein